MMNKMKLITSLKKIITRKMIKKSYCLFKNRLLYKILPVKLKYLNVLNLLFLMLSLVQNVIFKFKYKYEIFQMSI